MKFPKKSAALLLALSLAGCGAGVKNVETVKSADFTGAPRNIVGVQLNGDPFSASVKDAFKAKLASCGVALQFVAMPPPGQSINAPGAEAVLSFKEMSKETVTVSNAYGVLDKYPDKYRYEFALSDLKSRKEVWKGRGDFTTREQSKDNIFRGTPGEAWSQVLLELMKKDGLITDCDPAKLPVAATPTVAAAPANPGMTFNVGGKNYSQADQALDALRVLADQKVAGATPSGQKSYASLLVVMPTEEEILNASIRISGIPNEGEYKKYMVGLRRIQIESYVQAFRKTGMFKTVTMLTSSEVPGSDFHGNQYKLSYLKPPGKGFGSWTVASSKGPRQSFQMGPEDKNDVQAMLGKVQAAIEGMPR